MLLDLTELSSYLPLVSSFEFGNVSGDGGPRPRTTMTSAGTPPVRGPSTAAALLFAIHLPFTLRACKSRTAVRCSIQASKEDDMNGSQRMCVQTFARGV